MRKVSSLFSYRFIGAAMIAILAATSHAGADSAPFKTAWESLSKEQRLNFIAGYLKGSNDANEVLRIVSDFVREHPDEAISGIERLQQIYSLRDLDPHALAEEISSFFKDPANGDAGLSLAVSSAKAKLRGQEP